jgi:[NiFe] hydrogenase diaphorase moiety small subunit
MDIETCPVGCIIQKGRGFFAPIGEREYDKAPIGSEIEQRGEDPEA